MLQHNTYVVYKARTRSTLPHHNQYGIISIRENYAPTPNSIYCRQLNGQP